MASTLKSWHKAIKRPNVFHVRTLINNLYNKTNKCTNVYIYNFNISVFVGFIIRINKTPCMLKRFNVE